MSLKEAIQAAVWVSLPPEQEHDLVVYEGRAGDWVVTVAEYDAEPCGFSPGARGYRCEARAADGSWSSLNQQQAKAVMRLARRPHV